MNLSRLAPIPGSYCLGLGSPGYIQNRIAKRMARRKPGPENLLRTDAPRMEKRPTRSSLHLSAKENNHKTDCLLARSLLAKCKHLAQSLSGMASIPFPMYRESKHFSKKPNDITMTWTPRDTPSLKHSLLSTRGKCGG